MARASWTVCIAAATAVWLTGLAVQAQTAATQRYSASVVAVQDGDSMTVMHGEKKEKIILYGIDCPERGQEFGAEARKFTDDLCYRKDITVDVRGRDKYGRTIAEVYLQNGTDLNQELVKRGLAWWSDKFAPKEQALKQLQDTAKASHTGLWAAPNPIPPWIFRNGQRSVQAEIKTGK